MKNEFIKKKNYLRGDGVEGNGEAGGAGILERVRFETGVCPA